MPISSPFRNHSIVRLFVVVLGFTISFAQPRRKQDTPLSVCDVLSHLDRYRGKMVVLRGVLRGGYHGQVIVDATGLRVCSQLEHVGHDWPAAIAVTQWQEGDDIEDGPASFESNVDEIRNRLADAQRRTRENSNFEILATFQGELRSRKDVTISRTAEGWLWGTGYGQGGQYPALLVLKTVRDVTIIQSKHH